MPCVILISLEISQTRNKGVKTIVDTHKNNLSGGSDDEVWISSSTVKWFLAHVSNLQRDYNWNLLEKYDTEL